MEEDLISVIIPIYKVEKYLKNCIESVINQTYNNIEIILVDDGSPDNCGSICDEYAKKDSRIRVIHKKNGGLSDARNEGIEEANGKYITFIDSDDFVKENYVEVLYNLIIKHNTDIAICDCQVIKGDNGINSKEKKIIENTITSKEAILRMLYSDFFYISAWAKMYKTHLFSDVKYPKGKLFEDVGTTYRLILKSKDIVYSNRKIYYYVLRNNSITTANFKEQHMDLIKMTEQMCNDINEIYPEMKNAILRRLVYANISTLNRILLSKSDAKQKKVIVKFVKENGKELLKDKKVCLKDKIAIRLILCNLGLYTIFLYIYKKLG